MTERRLVQCLPMESPLRHMSMHQGHESVVMMPFNQVRQFVKDDVLQALHGLLRELQIQPNTPAVDAASAPFRLHPPDGHGA